jgi:hypothetical protein
LFAAGGKLLFEVKSVRADPLGSDGAVRFRVNGVAESLRPGSVNKKHVSDVTVASHEEDNTQTPRFQLDDVVSGVGVGCILGPVATYKKGRCPRR